MQAPATQSEAVAPARDAPRALLRSRLLGALGGPALIVVSVLFALRAFVLQPLLTGQHSDILAFILPRMAFLGRSLAAGHVPLWNPFEMTGTPYAADPQSGWLYAPTMLLFSLLSPGAAMRALIVLNPIVAGLGLYAFLRMEHLSRLAATAGALSLAMAIATSNIAISMPFSGAIAWTTILLVGAAGYVRARRLSARIGWLALSCFAWGQVAGAHMSHGLAMATLLVVAYLVAGSVRSAQEDERSGHGAMLGIVVFLLLLPLANLAILVPRLELLARSSLHAGYQALAGVQAIGSPDGAIQTNGVWSGWPFALGSAPGAYIGATILIAVPAAIRTVRHRALLAALGGVGILAYVLTLNAVVTAEWFRSFVVQLPYGDVYLHNPGRLRYLVYMVLPAIGAIGIQALLDRPLPMRRAARWLAAGVALWLLAPVALGAHPQRFVLLAAGCVAGSVALMWLAQGRRRRAAVAVTLVLVGELAASAVWSQIYEGGTVYLGLEGPPHPNLVPAPLRWPDVAEERFMAVGQIGRFLSGTQDRYLTWVQPAAYFVKGYLWTQSQRDWPALENERGTLFGAHDVLGYNPVQLPGYWSYVRGTNRLFTFYNAAVINEPTLEDIRLLGARYVIVPHGFQLPDGLGGLVQLTADGYDLVEITGWQPRASVVLDWRVVDGRDAALHAVLAPGFDPASVAVLESDPGIAPTASAQPATGSATYSESAPEDVRVAVRTPSPAFVVIRNNWERGWTAWVDGRPAPVYRADGFRQAVPVPAGRHQIHLVYADPSIGRGLLASGLVWLALGTAAATALLAERRRRRDEHRTITFA